MSCRPAVIEQTGAVNGRELLGKAMVAGEFLCGLNTPAGVPIPALLTTNADSLALLLAGAAADRPLAPLGARLSVPELAATVRNLDSDVIVTETTFADTARRVAGSVGARVAVVPAFSTSTQALPARCGPVAFYLHTSGTTGTPKPVPFSDEVLSARADVLSGVIGLGPDDRYASGSPLHHIGGLGNMLVALTVGAAVLPTTAFSWDWWRGLGDLQATHCLLVPSMIEMLLAENLLRTAPLKTLIYGAAPITPATLGRVMATLPNVALVNLFGQTEGSPVTHLSPEDHRRAAAGDSDLLETVGRPVPGLKVRIDTPDSSGTGEVLAAAGHLSARDADGWLHTGDLGSIDDEGYLRLRGRRHDMVIRGGENVYPLEVENVLVAHPLIAAAAVAGVPDQRLGETLAAFIKPVEHARPPNAEQLHAFARARLAGFKVPRYWYFVDSLPLNSAGKIVRTTLRAWHEERNILSCSSINAQ